MVFAHLKKEEESLFLLELTTSECIADICETANAIYNGRLVLFRICSGKYISNWFFFVTE